jgi:beta-N-acetylhexosaminidase
MNPTDKLGPVMIDLRGPELAAVEADRLNHPLVGGLILFSRNYQSVDQIAQLIAQIRTIRPEILIAVDHEGGRVQRFRSGFSRIPAASRYVDACPHDLAQAVQAAEAVGWLMAAELRSVDVDFSFAPVLDVDCGISEIIGDRSFSKDAETAARMASAFRRGMSKAGMAAVGKHFPGHGGVALDSHLALPVDNRSWAELQAKDLAPFRQLIAEGLEGIMPAHVIYEHVDASPAGFSLHWIREILRTELKFDGAVFSDDLSMAGARFAGGYPDRARLALEAGCDMVLVCNQPDAADEVLESLAALTMPVESGDRLSRMRGRFPVERAGLRESEPWRHANGILNRLQLS